MAAISEYIIEFIEIAKTYCVDSNVLLKKLDKLTKYVNLDDAKTPVY